MKSWQHSRVHLQVAYLEPERVELPRGVRQAFRDAHARLGGTACGSKHVLLHMSAGMLRPGRLSLAVDQRGRMVAPEGGPVFLRPLASNIGTLLRQARMAGDTMRAACWDVEAVRRAGLRPWSAAALLLEARVWRLEGLAWRQRQQRRRQEEEGGVRSRWERRGGAGRRGRRRREPGVVFELGPWGEERRPLPHAEAARVVVGATALFGFV